MLGNLPPRDALLAFASERESIRRRKEAGEPWPYTSDPTLNRFSFTNVRREDDKTTRHCAALVRNRYKHHRVPSGGDNDLSLVQSHRDRRVAIHALLE